MKTIHDVVQFWDTSLYILYNRKAFTEEFKKIISRYGATKNSDILDVSAGTGFLALDLKKEGYNIEINDASKSMLRKLKANAKNLATENIEVTNILWQLLSNRINKQFDLLLCRGNSLVYVNSWHKRTNNLTIAKKIILLSLRNFYDILKPNGILWIDITSDEEISKGPKVIENFRRIVNGELVEMTWKITHNKKIKLRTIKGSFNYYNIQHKHTFYSYLMASDELIKLLQEVGFRKIEKIRMKNEIYTVLIARK